MTPPATRTPYTWKKRLTPRFRRVAAVFGLCALVLPVTGFWAPGQDAQRGIAAVRMRIDFTSACPLPEVPAISPSAAFSHSAATYRAALRDIPAPAGGEQTFQTPRERQSLIVLSDNQVALALADGTRLPLRRISNPKPSQVYRFWTQSATFLPADGRHRDADPTNTRWLTDAAWKLGEECGARAETSLEKDMRLLILRLRTPESMRSHPSSSRYLEFINQSSRRFGLSPHLVYAIMRTESAFNPFAVSNAGALGLMQVVPDTAGTEVRAYLTGKQENPSTSFLFNPKSNIEYGCAYLHLLSSRYFSGVRNRTSRELCMIAGYNAGPNAVLKLFADSGGDAVDAINLLSPEELFQKISHKMPAAETRRYVGKVLAALASYPG